ncbi:MAG: hypothetical protein QM692_14800 [Thermomicrobiales bacterium]
MNRDFALVRVLLAIGLIALPVVLMAATLEPLERSPARSGRNTEVQQPAQTETQPAVLTPAATP